MWGPQCTNKVIPEASLYTDTQTRWSQKPPCIQTHKQGDHRSLLVYRHTNKVIPEASLYTDPQTRWSQKPPCTQTHKQGDPRSLLLQSPVVCTVQRFTFSVGNKPKHRDRAVPLQKSAVKTNLYTWRWPTGPPRRELHANRQNYT
jgi:hypothetical protein